MWDPKSDQIREGGGRGGGEYVGTKTEQSCTWIAVTADGRYGFGDVRPKRRQRRSELVSEYLLRVLVGGAVGAPKVDVQGSRSHLLQGGSHRHVWRTITVSTSARVNRCA